MIKGNCYGQVLLLQKAMKDIEKLIFLLKNVY